MRKQRSDKGTFKDTGRTQPDVVVSFRLSPGHADYPQDEDAVDYLKTFTQNERRAMLTRAILMHKYENIPVPEPQNAQVADLMQQLRDLVDQLLSAELQPVGNVKKKKKTGSVPMDYLLNLKQMLNPGTSDE